MAANFSIILSLITQSVFIAKTCVWVLCKGYLFRKIQKIKKLTTTIFFKKKNWFRLLEVELLKMQFFNNLKKSPLNNNYMMYVWLKLFVAPAETFFLLIFKDCPLENLDRFLKIALPIFFEFCSINNLSNALKQKFLQQKLVELSKKL
jgi:hypothetical protein